MVPIPLHRLIACYWLVPQFAIVEVYKSIEFFCLVKCNISRFNKLSCCRIEYPIGNGAIIVS